LTVLNMSRYPAYTLAHTLRLNNFSMNVNVNRLQQSHVQR